MMLVAAALAGELAGTLTGHEGEPVVGATVVAYDPRYSYATATTRSGGEWTIAGLPGNPYRVLFFPSNADPHADGMLGGVHDVCSVSPVALGDDASIAGLDAQLDLGGAVAGTVTDIAGQPLPDVVMAVRGLDARNQVVYRTATTAVDGSFTVVGLDAEPTGSRYSLQFDADGWPAQYLGGAYSAAGAAPVTVALGESTAAGTYAMLDGIAVEGRVSGPGGPVSSGTAYVYSDGQVLAPSIGSDGRYLADGLPPGDVVAWASSTGLATTYYPDSDRTGAVLPVPEEGTVATIDFDLPPESTVRFQFAGDGDLGEVAVLVYNDTYTVGRGDGAASDGTVTLGGFYPGDYFVYVFGDDAGFVSGFAMDGADRRRFEVDGDSRFELTLDAAAVVSGTVTDDEGNPVYGAVVTATELGGDDPRSWDTTTDRDGTYRVLGIDAVDVTVSGRSWWYCPSDPGWADTWYEGARVAEAGRALALSHGEEQGGVDFVMPVDDDHDGMGDAWERQYGLDPSRDDGDEDLDGDGYSNLDEWLLDTDPSGGAAGAGSCEGCRAGGSAPVAAVSALLSLAAATRRRRVAPSR